MSSGLNLRLTEVIPEINVGEYNLPYPVGEAGAPTGESLMHLFGWNTRSILTALVSGWWMPRLLFELLMQVVS